MPICGPISFNPLLRHIPKPRSCCAKHPTRHKSPEEFVEKTLVLIKPDGVQRGLIGTVITRLEQRGLRLVAAKFLKVSHDLAERHYGIHQGKSFYNNLITYITSAPVMA